MNKVNSVILRKETVFDILSMTAVLLLPSLIHFLNFDLSVIEPFRIVVLSSLLLRNRLNTFLLCFSLPFLTNIISGHPYFIKSALIAAELSFNVLLFNLLNGRTGKVLISISVSIFASKLLYYSMKYILLYTGAINGSLVSTPFLYQFISFIALSLLFSFTYSKKRG